MNGETPAQGNNLFDAEADQAIPPELIDRCLNGDSEAWTLLLRNADKIVMRFLSTQYSNIPAESLKDIRQDALLKASKKLHTYKGAGFLSWLLAITRNTALDWHKTRVARDLEECDSLDDMESASEPRMELSPDVALMEKEVWKQMEAQKEALDQGLNILTNENPLAARVIVLRYREEMSLLEISTMLNETIARVRALLAKAIARLKELCHAVLRRTDSAGRRTDGLSYA